MDFIRLQWRLSYNDFGVENQQLHAIFSENYLGM